MAQPIFFFPNLKTVGWSVHKKPIFNSLVSTHVSGREVISPQQAFALYEFELTYEVLREQTQNQSIYHPNSPFTELQQLWGLYTACNGQFGLFYFTDPSDSSRAAEQLGIGGNSVTTFTATRKVGTIGTTEPVGGINQLQAVYFNGSQQPSSTYSFSGNQITFTVAAPGPGVVITIDFTYFFLCRFLEDNLDFEQFMYNLWTLKSLKFRSVKL